jgi:hypothetical protein
MKDNLFILSRLGFLTEGICLQTDVRKEGIKIRIDGYFFGLQRYLKSNHPMNELKS